MKKVLYGALALAMILPMVSFAEEGTMMMSSDSMKQKSSMMDGSGSMERKVQMNGSGSMEGKNPMMDEKMKGLHMAMGKLSDTDREEMIKMIRTFLESKGIIVPTKEEMKEKKEDVKTIRKEAKTEIKTMRQNSRDAIKAKREEMKAKIRDRKNGSGTTVPPPTGSGTSITGTVSI